MNQGLGEMTMPSFAVQSCQQLEEAEGGDAVLETPMTLQGSLYGDSATVCQGNLIQRARV
jgi:hypothetical protein